MGWGRWSFSEQQSSYSPTAYILVDGEEAGRKKGEEEKGMEEKKSRKEGREGRREGG